MDVQAGGPRSEMEQLAQPTMREIDDIVAAAITNRIGPEFMAPPVGLVA